MTGRAAQTDSFAGGSLGFPALAAGVPADEAVPGDEQGDALEEHAVFLGRVVYRELGDSGPLPHHWNTRPPRLDGSSRAWAENELALFDEEDPGPGVARLLA